MTAVIVDSKFWDAKQKYVTNNGPFLWVGPILINNDFYNSLPLALRSVVDRAGAEAAEFEWDWVGKKNAEFKQTMLDKGMQIDELEDKPKWIEASKGLWDDYAKTAEKKSIIKNVLTITQK